jgi:hypothetical protein
LKSGIIKVPDFDMQLSRRIFLGNKDVILFCADLIKDCCFSSTRFCRYTDFLTSINQMRQLNEKPELVQSLLAKVDNEMFLKKLGAVLNTNSETLVLIKSLEQIFEEWIEVSVHPGSNDEIKKKFIDEVSLI